MKHVKTEETEAGGRPGAKGHRETARSLGFPQSSVRDLLKDKGTTMEAPGCGLRLWMTGKRS